MRAEVGQLDQFAKQIFAEETELATGGAARFQEPVELNLILERVAPGCYQVGPASFPFLWITANELPLSDELIPFLIARSGRPLDEFCRWVVTRKPLAWVMRMVEFLPMSEPVYKEMTGWLSAASYDPRLRERKANWERILQEAEQRALEELVKEGRNEGRLAEAREGLRRVLALRKLAPTGDDEARIEACSDLATLHRWHDQAIEAPTAAEALR